MHYVVAAGNMDVLRYVVEEWKIDMEVKDKEGNGALFTAVEHGLVDVVRYLVEEVGMSVFGVKEGNIGVLHLAANSNNVGLIDYFISKGCDIEKMSIYGKPINWAVGSRHI